MRAGFAASHEVRAELCIRHVPIARSQKRNVKRLVSAILALVVLTPLVTSSASPESGKEYVLETPG